MDVEFVDITAPEHLEVEIRADGSVVWVHVDGRTYLRACRIGDLVITDHREDHIDPQQIRDAISQLEMILSPLDHDPLHVINPMAVANIQNKLKAILGETS